MQGFIGMSVDFSDLPSSQPRSDGEKDLATTVNPQPGTPQPADPASAAAKVRGETPPQASSATPPPGPRLPPELANHPRYRLLGLLGVGGMGAVYKAKHRLMDRLVALKVIRKKLLANPDAVERFRREVMAAARLAHPNIVTAYDAEQAGETHFLVMELVEGASLDRLVAEHGPLPIEQACDSARQVALALQHAFERGMVHRDIKPQNLMLTTQGQIKVLDFGLARFLTESAAAEEPAQSPGDSGLSLPAPATTQIGSPSSSSSGSPSLEMLTQAGTMMGTPDYMAPEQARDASTADIRADIYGLGCTLYFLLSGVAPFYADTLLRKLRAHQERTPRSLSTLRRDLPAELIAILERMMAKRPEDRYQSPAEVAAALQSLAQRGKLAAAGPVTAGTEGVPHLVAVEMAPSQVESILDVLPAEQAERTWAVPLPVESELAVGRTRAVEMAAWQSESIPDALPARPAEPGQISERAVSRVIRRWRKRCSPLWFVIAAAILIAAAAVAIGYGLLF
jgi:tRNA A-37 threonylcarbamoyl transferase component Bud32